MAKFQYYKSITSVILRVFIHDSASTAGAGKTGLTSASAGLVISTIADTEATATVYTAAATNIETITTLGTYAAPTTGKCRFREVDATNVPGVYEIQLADARWAVTNARSFILSVHGATGAAPCLLEVEQEPQRVWARDHEGEILLATTRATQYLSYQADGVAQAGGVSTITLAAASSSTGGSYVGSVVKLYSGTGAGQSRTIIAYDTATKVATVNRAWTVQPVINTGYVILSSYHPDEVTAGVTTNVNLDKGDYGLSAGAIDSTKFLAGAINAAAIAAGAITAAKFAAGAIDVNAIATDAIGSAELAASAVAEIAGAVWEELRASHVTAGSFGQGVASVQGNVTGSVGSVTGAVGSVTAAVTVGVNNDKTGYALSAAGLDSINTTPPIGVAANFREMMIQVWRRFFKKATMTTTQLKTYADDGVTVVTTQVIADDGTTQTQNSA